MYIKADVNEIRNAVNYVKDALEKRKIKSKDITKAVLTTEEIVRAMIEHISDANQKVYVNVISVLGSVEVVINSRGSEFDLSDVQNYLQLDDDIADAKGAKAINSLVSRVLGEGVSINNSCGINTANITVEKSKYRQFFITLIALLTGVIFGFIVKTACPENISQGLINYLLSPLTTMFLNALKVIVGPLVLFSIASSIADFGDMKSLGRIAGKVIACYTITSFIAIFVGALVWYVFPIGDPALKALVSDAANSTIESSKNVSVSILDELIDIIPSNIISPFLNADMLEIIFMAVMIGVAAGAVSEKITVFKSFIADSYLICSRITTIIIGFMPFAIFASMAKMIISMELKSFLSVFVWIPTIYLGDILMLCVYSLIIIIFARLNPFTFFKKYYPAMFVAFTLASSNAALPTSMETCGERLGISKKVYSFSLPLGATINMDGSCVTLIISALFMAKIYGLPVTASMLFKLVFSIFVLSVGAPGVPGAALICISLLVPQIGVPAEAISIIMGLYFIVGMMQVLTNVTGDAVVTLVVAKGEKLVDLNTFKE